MYMMELIPVVGSFFIILQRLIMLFLKYCVILVVVGAVFVIFFFTSVSQSATGNTTGIFDTFPNAIFSTFQLSIIGFSLGTIQETHVRVARCLLFFSVLLVLLSFLSSVLQMLLIETDQHKTMTWRLRRLEASIAIEDRLVRWLWGILVRHLRRRREPLAVTVVKTLKGRPAFSLSLERRRKKKDRFGSDFSLDELEVVIGEFSESKEV
ncbi:uncharacterized protein LOC135482632 [Lineus longissimus]|uniref:uncharacterized protein LOC135482632 n=1 Tax=Lineus longissimus TaxID=88925 RepID=UPI00315DA85C